MSWGGFYWPAVAVVIVGGLVPAVGFVATYRPRRRLDPDQLDAGGWVQMVALLYMLSGWQLVTGQRRLPHVPEGTGALAIGAAIDALLWFRLVRWTRMRRRWWGSTGGS